MEINLKLFASHLISFLLGGMLVGGATFYFYGYFIGKWNNHNTYVSQALLGKQSIRIVKYIRNGKQSEAIRQLEQNIYTSMATLDGCIDCFEREKQSLKEISEYEFTEYAP